MRMSEKVRFAVTFGHAVRRERLNPTDLGELITLSAKAFNAAEREANGGKSADSARGRVEQKAKSMGLKTQWAGLGPTFYRGSYQVAIPWAYA